ncbi:hypothetical protein EYC80_004440 [Monilinia laxa]|uniref:Uncharacterized protein n=1 Tax=Monilinia laxa TaxID=61186 RepID=A0A5N6KN12_MONLA|nr:hypothetical protein EYC80_004440 [Monilinia laxa]
MHTQSKLFLKSSRPFKSQQKATRYTNRQAQPNDPHHIITTRKRSTGLEPTTQIDSSPFGMMPILALASRTSLVIHPRFDPPIAIVPVFLHEL